MRIAEFGMRNNIKNIHPSIQPFEGRLHAE